MAPNAQVRSTLFLPFSTIRTHAHVENPDLHPIWGGKRQKKGKKGKAHTIPQLPHPNEPAHILIKHLKPPAILFRLARLPEPTGAVQHFLEAVKVDCLSPNRDKCQLPSFQDYVTNTPLVDRKQR